MEKIWKRNGKDGGFAVQMLQVSETPIIQQRSRAKLRGILRTLWDIDRLLREDLNALKTVKYTYKYIHMIHNDTHAVYIYI